MTKFALFGDSYVKRLQLFCDGRLSLPSSECTTKFFCAGGMRADRLHAEERFRKQLDRLIDFRPDIVFINLGGNDIHATSTPAEICRHIQSLVDLLRERGIKKIFYQEIGKRGKFRGTLSPLHFERQRQAINKKLRKKFKDACISVAISFPLHFHEDLVHYSPQGMKTYFHSVRRVFMKQLPLPRA